MSNINNPLQYDMIPYTIAIFSRRAEKADGYIHRHCRSKQIFTIRHIIWDVFCVRILYVYRRRWVPLCDDFISL